eukprot:m.65176 g.65176  ORF g.65176 m.65176 type:complete len:420 (+) comp11714_c0_seq3:166-1425(+)
MERCESQDKGLDPTISARAEKEGEEGKEDGIKDDEDDIDDLLVPCDNPACKKMCKGLRCSRCQCEFYCSKDCQRAIWKEHKIVCNAFDKQEKQRKNNKDTPKDILGQAYQDLEEAKKKARENEDTCSVCLEPFKAPLLLQCSHMFCVACIASGKAMIGVEEFHCPLCRANMENPLVDMYVLYMNAFGRAYRIKRKYPEEVKQLELKIREDAEEMIAALTDLSGESWSRLLIQDGVIESYMSTEQWEEAIAVGIEMEKTLLSGQPLMHCGRLAVSPNMHPTTLLARTYSFMGTSYLKLKKVDEASDTIGKAFKSMDEGGLQMEPKMMRNFAHLSCLVRYAQGKYDDALDIGQCALEMNRHYEGIYKALADCAVAKGDLDKAIEWMRQGVKYETPWDEENHKKVLNYLRELKQKAKTSVNE